MNCRSRWLKEPNLDSNELFRMVAEIFILWCKSHVSSIISLYLSSLTYMNDKYNCVYSAQNFKREEQNFVVQNEINNLSFLTGDNKTKMSKV